MKNSTPLRPWQSGILNKNPILIKNASKYQFREMPIGVFISGSVCHLQHSIFLFKIIVLR